MKKVLIILCFYLLNVSAQADRQERRFSNFNKWLAQNEFKEFYKLGFGEAKGKCKDLEKFSHLWYYNKCDKQKKLFQIIM